MFDGSSELEQEDEDEREEVIIVAESPEEKVVVISVIFLLLLLASSSNKDTKFGLLLLSEVLSVCSVLILPAGHNGRCCDCDKKYGNVCMCTGVTSF